MQFQTPLSPSSDKSASNCIKCGVADNTSNHKFKKKYVSPVATLGILIGLLPYFLFRLLLTTTHDLSAPFCEACWKGRFEKVPFVNQVSVLGVVLSILLGIGIAVNLGSPLLFFIIFAVGISGAIAAKIFEWRMAPKYKRVDDKVVVIDAPIVGELVFTK